MPLVTVFGEITVILVHSCARARRTVLIVRGYGRGGRQKADGDGVSFVANIRLRVYSARPWAMPLNFALW